MIDVLSVITDLIRRSIPRSKYGNVLVSSVPLATFRSLPAVEILRVDNATYRKTRGIDLKEHHAVEVIQIRVTSNKMNGAMEEARALIRLIDGVLEERGFLRIECRPVVMEDRTLYSLTARYRGVVSELREIDGKNTHLIF